MNVRRSWDGVAWHWRRNCSSWPPDIASEERGVLPRGARLCTECAALDLQSALHHMKARDRADALRPV
jgi:hypothetical protein